ncbi:2',3'-cyclic-nucleotide 3'-phosphodiesterase [Pholiota molesta]|nr:2',3'-cyclic-nucleotide 3'-phosphodiesterase [Pholiota molesta]
MGLSLWIVPNSDDSETIEALMNVRSTTASEHLARESYPKFHPHITLASLPLSMETTLDAVESAISKIQAPPICKFASVDVGSEYHRSVYIAIQLTSEMSSLHLHMHEELKVEPRTPAFPHLSLCYIANVDADSEGEREKYRQALQDKIQIRGKNIQNQGVIIFPGLSDGGEWLDHFVAHEIWVVRCEGPVESWVVLRKFTFPKD